MSRLKSIFPIHIKLYYILLILQLIFYFIKCEECSECLLDTNYNCIKKEGGENCGDCFPSFGAGKCYKRKDNIVYDSTYHSINNNSDFISMESTGCQNKVINKNKECVGHCPKNTYELGDFCYIQNEIYDNANGESGDKLIKDNYIEHLSSLECKYKYIIKEVSNSNRKEYTCLGKDEECVSKNQGYEYYDGKTNQCMKDCLNKKKKDNGHDKDKRCSDDCQSGEYLSSVIEGEKAVTICSENSDSCQFFFSKNNANINICVNECNEEEFVEGKECVSKCNKKIFVDLSSTSKKIECSESNPDSNVYKFLYENNYYFKSCTDTQLLTKLKRITYESKYESEDQNKCVDDCSTESINKYIVNGEYKCTNCSNLYYYGKICYNKCPPEHSYIILDEPVENESSLPKQCADKCPAGYYESENKQCYPLNEENEGINCPDDQFINSIFQCNTCKKPVNSSSIKEGEGYYVKDKRICYSSCPLNALFHDIDKNECSNTICENRDNYKYSAYDNPYICYESCKSIGADYKYEKDYICYKTQATCDSYYYIENGITQCASYEKCKEKGFKYIQEKQCVKVCKENYYKIAETNNTNGEIQNLGGCFPDERGCINEEYFYYNKTAKICLRECDAYKLSKTEKIKNEFGETCFSSCPSSQPFMDSVNNLCLVKCPAYYYKNECLTGTCKENDKYNFEGEFECLDSCQKKIEDSTKYYYYDGDNICHDSCHEIHQFSLPKDNSPVKCEESCDPEIYKFYYDDKRICRDSCDILYKGTSGNDKFICVSQCASGQKVYNNICYDDCPSREPDTGEFKIYKENLNSKSSLIVEKCVEDCSNHLSSNSTNYCYDECPPNESYKYNNICWENCPEGTFANPITKECHKECPEGLNFYDIKDGIKMCKIFCPSNKFILSNETNGGMCYDKCPSDYNYIGRSNTCLKSCSEQPDIGQYIVEIDHSNEYPIYKCSFSCGKNYTVIETKECHKECPDGSYTSPNKMCYSTNCSIDSDYPFSTIDDSGKNVCAKKCHKDYPNFGDDKICSNECKNNEIIDYDGKCVSKCESPYYKYYENGKCVQKCSEGKKSLKNNTCVAKCINNENYVEGNECRTSCDSDHFQKYNSDTDDKEIICVEKCESNQFYYETGSIYNIYKCLPKCNEGDYIIEGTQICVKECSSQYYTYYNDTDKRCVLKCPSDKLFTDHRTCMKECPKAGNKYHIEGETNCRYSCPEGSKIDNNVCKSICPEDKYLDFKGENCINECVGNYLYYIEGINQCLRECPIKNGYFIEGKKCVTSCSEKNPFLNGVNCQDECDKYVEEYSYNNCTEKCPDDHPFYKKGIIGEKDIKSCIRNCELSMPDGECVSQCNETFNHINYENGTCLKECPGFYVTNSDNITCYAKCPGDFPFYNITTKECMKECKENEYINITNNQCIDICNFKTFDNEGKIYCLKDCDDLGLFKFGENQCLKDCSNGEETSNMIPNFATKTCECKQLYTIKDGKTNCLTEEQCSGTDKYRLFGTQMCLNDCNDYILSFDEKYCYKSEKYCPQNTRNTSYEEGEKVKYKCFCSFKFYKNGGNYVCLNENEECPSEHKNLILETNECIENCNEDKYVNIGNLCLNQEECNNNEYWYLDENNKYQCTDKCPDNYNYLIEETKQCVSNCSSTEYYITHQKKCISTCPSNTIVQKTYISLNDGSKELIYICACTTDLWYKDNTNNIICVSDTTKSKCEDIDPELKFQVKDTKECVKSCPDDHPFSFDNECFIKCEDIKNYYDYDIIQNENNKECKCKDLWKRDSNGKMVCIEDKMCNGEETNLLIEKTRECTKECPSEEGKSYKKFNNTCYEDCPHNLEKDGEDKCKCKYKWYKYNDSLLKVNNIIICFDNENIDCPKDFYPYLNLKTNECIEDFSKCDIENKKIFNDFCGDKCPENTKEDDDNTNCICDKDIENVVWHKYTNNGKIYLVCGLQECPPDKIYLHYDTKECKYSCDDKYRFKNGCYDNCPEGTKLVDKISKECTEYISFDDSGDLESLNTKVEREIESIYGKTSTVGLVYNIKNSTMQLYGVNKKKTPRQELLMRSNLTYIDLSYCIDKLYEDNNLEDDADIVIVKYDLGDATDSTTINPVEFKLFNSKNGQEINNLNACKDNSIVISYPLSSILNNFPTESESKKLRNIEEKEVINLNLRQKFLKGKELNLENEEIDTFNIENKIYTDMCYPLKINGIDLILEDRVTYLYPEFTFCESNCVYNKTDFNLERIYCNCSPKDGFNLEREFVAKNTPVDEEKVKSNQKGTLLKCLFKVSNIAHNFGFFYGLIVLLAEIGLMILTLVYSYKMLYALIERKYNLNKKSIDLDNVENDKLSDKIYKNKKKEEIIKTTERVLQEDGNPPKKNYKYNVYDYNKKKDTKKVFEDKKKNKNKTDAINVEKIEKLKIDENKDNKIDVLNSQNASFEKSEVSTEADIDDENIFDLIEAEEKLLRLDYDNAIKNNKSEILITIITEILDKIYLIKSIWLLQKYELFSLYFSLYLLWHMLLLSFLSLFYNNSTFHKIWTRDSYPDLSYYLSFGFVSGIISFIIYKALSFLINYSYKLNEIKNIPKEETEQQYNKIKFWNKIKLIIYYIVEFALLIVFFLYLISFCGVYTGTQSKLVQSYGITLIEIVIIKIIYGLILGILRRVSLSYKINKLYNVVRLLDIYLS